MKRFALRALSTTFATITLAASVAAANAETIKVAFIDPLSGPFAGTGQQALAQYRFAFDRLVNKAGGVLDGDTIEVVPFDNKISAKESLIQLGRD